MFIHEIHIVVKILLIYASSWILMHFSKYNDGTAYLFLF